MHKKRSAKAPVYFESDEEVMPKVKDLNFDEDDLLDLPPTIPTRRRVTAPSPAIRNSAGSSPSRRHVQPSPRPTTTPSPKLQANDFIADKKLVVTGKSRKPTVFYMGDDDDDLFDIQVTTPSQNQIPNLFLITKKQKEQQQQVKIKQSTSSLALSQMEEEEPLDLKSLDLKSLDLKSLEEEQQQDFELEEAEVPTRMLGKRKHQVVDVKPTISPTTTSFEKLTIEAQKLKGQFEYFQDKAMKNKSWIPLFSIEDTKRDFNDIIRFGIETKAQIPHCILDVKDTITGTQSENPLNRLLDSQKQLQKLTVLLNANKDGHSLPLASIHFQGVIQLHHLSLLVRRIDSKITFGSSSTTRFSTLLSLGVSFDFGNETTGNRRELSKILSNSKTYLPRLRKLSLTSTQLYNERFPIEVPHLQHIILRRITNPDMDSCTSLVTMRINPDDFVGEHINLILQSKKKKIQLFNHNLEKIYLDKTFELPTDKFVQVIHQFRNNVTKLSSKFIVLLPSDDEEKEIIRQHFGISQKDLTSIGKDSDLYPAKQMLQQFGATGFEFGAEIEELQMFNF